jgi:FemAB-related protein (PEP-CTERM system-associated)
MKIELLQKIDKKRWNEFVAKNPEANFGHLLGWREIIKKSYGHKGLYLVAKEGAEIQGILPAFIIEHFFFGKKIVSMPFLNYGGVVAKSLEAQDALIDYLKRNKYNLFELRSLTPIKWLSADLSQFTFLLELNVSEDSLLEKLDKKVRNQIKKADQFGFELKIGNQYLNEFYGLYQKTMKRLGTPVHSLLFFKNIIKEFPEQTKIFTAFLKNKPVASFIIFIFKDTALNLWAASDAKYSEMNPNNFLYWETIKYYAKAGFKYFDFGRSEKDSGTFNFKKQWGTKARQLYYQRYPEAVSDKEKFGSFAKIWKRLPLSVANFVGPFLRRYIP